MTSTDINDEKKAKKIYNGLTSCVSDQHVHVECKEDVVSHLIEMAEPELTGLRQERHAKTIEIAQKEVLTCIGICLYERFQRIQQRLREGQQACDLLFYVALLSLKHSFEMAFDSKQGISDLERLCQEFDEEDRKKQEKAQKKREKKKKKKDSTASLPLTNQQPAVMMTSAKADENSSKVTNENANPQTIQKSRASQEIENQQPIVLNSNNKKQTNQQNIEMPASLQIIKKFEKKTRGHNNQNAIVLKENEPINFLKIAHKFDGNNDDYEEPIPVQDIKVYLDDVAEQRAELRRKLRLKFSQFCDKKTVNGL